MQNNKLYRVPICQLANCLHHILSQRRANVSSSSSNLINRSPDTTFILFWKNSQCDQKVKQLIITYRPAMCRQSILIFEQYLIVQVFFALFSLLALTPYQARLTRLPFKILIHLFSYFTIEKYKANSIETFTPLSPNLCAVGKKTFKCQSEESEELLATTLHFFLE